MLVRVLATVDTGDRNVCQDDTVSVHTDQHEFPDVISILVQVSPTVELQLQVISLLESGGNILLIFRTRKDTPSSLPLKDSEIQFFKKKNLDHIRIVPNYWNYIERLHMCIFGGLDLIAQNLLIKGFFL